MSTKNNCFGTKEYSKNSGICKNCKNFISCGAVENKKPVNKKAMR